jgi:hypothetical protein
LGFLRSQYRTPGREQPWLPFITILAAPIENLAILAANIPYHPYKPLQTVKKIHKRQKRLLYQAESLMAQPLAGPKTSNASPASGTAAS